MSRSDNVRQVECWLSHLSRFRQTAATGGLRHITMREVFIPWKPHAATLTVADQANTIIDQYLAQGFKLTRAATVLRQF
jgi:hypothetical protein